MLAFLYIARGSAGETRSGLRFAAGRPELAQLKSGISDLISACESVSRQLHGWIQSLQNSDIEGVRHLNDRTRAEYEQRRRQAAFVANLEAIRTRAAQVPEPTTETEG